jgi:hypothetical protein
LPAGIRRRAAGARIVGAGLAVLGWPAESWTKGPGADILSGHEGLARVVRSIAFGFLPTMDPLAMSATPRKGAAFTGLSVARLTLPLLAVGGEGVISVVGNIMPREVIELRRLFAAGDAVKARHMHYRLFPLYRDMLGLATNPIPIKAAMKMLGRDSGEVRLPLTPLEEASEAELRQTLDAYGLL